MAPVSVAGTLTQVLAEVLAGVSYNQLIRPGAPVIFGTFVTSIDMNSGAPTFGTPEASHILYGAGQLARRLGLPYRSGGGLCGSKLPDAQAAYETSNTLNAALMGGVNFMLHACGWLEGGLVSSFEKFVMDADQLGILHHLAKGVSVDENAQAMDAIREVGPGGHYLGCAHTQANFKEAFWRTGVLDYKPFETWDEEGARDTYTLAAARVKTMLETYQKPAMDSAVNEACTPMWRRKRPLCQIALPKQPFDAIARSLGSPRQSARLKWRYDLGFDMRRRLGAASCLTRPLFQIVYLLMPIGFWVFASQTDAVNGVCVHRLSPHGARPEPEFWGD